MTISGYGFQLPAMAISATPFVINTLEALEVDDVARAVGLLQGDWHQLIRQLSSKGQKSDREALVSFHGLLQANHALVPEAVERLFQGAVNTGDLSDYVKGGLVGAYFKAVAEGVIRGLVLTVNLDPDALSPKKMIPRLKVMLENKISKSIHLFSDERVRRVRLTEDEWDKLRTTECESAFIRQLGSQHSSALTCTMDGRVYFEQWLESPMPSEKGAVIFYVGTWTDKK